MDSIVTHKARSISHLGISKRLVINAFVIFLLSFPMTLITPVRADDTPKTPKVLASKTLKAMLAQKASPDEDDLPPTVLSIVGSDAVAMKSQDKDGDSDDVQRGPAEGQHDFGRVSVLDQPQVQHVFCIKNISNTALVIASLHPSCSCTTAHIEPIAFARPPEVSAKALKTNVRGSAVKDSEDSDSDDDKATVPVKQIGKGMLTLAPGQEADVRMQVDLTDSGPAVLTKTVTIFVQNTPRPVGYLTMTGTILPSVTFKPAFLDFGSLTTGQSRSLTIKADLDKRLVTKGAVPALISTNPDVQAVAEAQPAGKTPNSKTVTKEQTYLVTLAKSAPLGSFSGSLSFAPSIAVASSGAGSVAQPSPAQVSALTRVSALVLGQVTGDVSALPSQMAFGTIRLGHQATRQIVLTGVDDSALTGMKASSTSPWLIARLGNLNEQPVFGSGGQPVPASRVLYLTISEATPPGVLQSQVKVTLANGQRLLLPVSANVAMPGSL